ncbi:uncharacterized protein [Miscanthus floridulus]|uniref:uncharacterized protein n=1 Tax=Miscanthus floridulus TaxID=154761 RepID=UPI003458435F
MARRQRLSEMTPDEPIDGVWLSAVTLSDEEILHRVRETVEGRLRSSGLTPFPMCPSWGYISLGMRDVAHAKAYKKWKDTKEERCKRKGLKHDELEKCRRQQRHDGLLVEPSPSPSLMDSSSDDDESEVGWGPLDHLPNVRGMALGASVSGLASLGGGGEDASGLAIAHPGAEANTLETRVLGKHAINPLGSMAEVERVTMGVTPQPPQRVEGASESGAGWPAPANTGAVPPPLPPLLQRMRDVVRKLLCPHSSQKHQAEAPALALHKALKVSTSSTTQWVVEAQAAIQRGVASARADLKEPVTQGEVTEVTMKQAGEEAPTPCEAEALEPGEAETPLVTEATVGEAEAPRTSKAEAAEAGASMPSKAEVAEVRALGTTKAEATEAGVGAAKPAAQDVEMEVGQASVPPLVQDPPPLQGSTREVEVHSISSDDTSRGKEVADVEAASTAE